jgi:hypothetical protein
MNKAGWPRCILESAILWIVILPLLQMGKQAIDSGVGLEKLRYEFPLQNGSDFDFLGLVFLMIYIVFVAGMLRHGRKGLLEK